MWTSGWRPGLHGINRLEQLRSKLTEALLSRYTHAQRKLLDEFAPTHLTVPTGTRVAVDYEDDNAPCIEVRMQEVFGLADTDTPRVAGGRVPVTMKLLSPPRAGRCRSRVIWPASGAAAMPRCARTCAAGIPRHYWPENPLEAEPLRGLRPRRS